jgi:hypothetical protein
MFSRILRGFPLVALVIAPTLVRAQSDLTKAKWLQATAYVIPKETATEGEGYFSIIEGLNRRLYIGTHANGVNSWLVEFDPAKKQMKVVVNAHKAIGKDLRGFGSQAKIHTRNNVGASGKIYFGTKQGYPGKGEKREDYPGGYPMVYDPATGKTKVYPIPVPHEGINSSGHPINWDITPDGKTLYSLPMSTNRLYVYDLTQKGAVLAGRDLGTLVPNAKQTDCRAMCVGPKGTAWAAITVAHPTVGQLLHLVSYRPGTKAPRDHGPVAVRNPNFTQFTDKAGKPLPFHGGFTKLASGVTTTKYVILGVCEARDGNVYILALHPYSVLQVPPAQLKS